MIGCLVMAEFLVFRCHRLQFYFRLFCGLVCLLFTILTRLDLRLARVFAHPTENTDFVLPNVRKTNEKLLKLFSLFACCSHSFDVLCELS